MDLLEILVIVVLILLNAVFVAAEIALVTVRRTRIEQLIDEGRRGAERVRRLTAQPGRFLAVIQLGITFIGFLAAAFAGASMADELAVALKRVPALVPVCRRPGPDRRDRPAELLHDHLRRARPEDPRARPSRAVRPRPRRAGRRHRPGPAARSSGRSTRITSAVNRLLGVHGVDQNMISDRGAEAARRARRRAGHPRGRGGADDPRGHRARRAPRPRGDGPAHRDRRPAGDRDARRGDRPDRRGRPLADPGLRGVGRRGRRHPLRQGPAAVPEERRRGRVRRSGRSSGRRSSCRSR